MGVKKFTFDPCLNCRGTTSGDRKFWLGKNEDCEVGRRVKCAHCGYPMEIRADFQHFILKRTNKVD